MLLQLHQQSRSDPSVTELVAQCDPEQIPFVTKEWTADTIQEWIKEVQSRHPIDDAHCWMLCDEGSPHFVRAAKSE